MAELRTIDGLGSFTAPIAERRPGGVEGVGLFATQDIQPEEIIAFKGGRLISSETLAAYGIVVAGSHQQVARNLFLAGLAPEEVDATLIGYNHSCVPNAHIFGQRGLRAATHIEQGQEVLVDYATCYSDETQSFECACREPQCRGAINPAADAFDPAIKGRYKGRLADHLARPEAYDDVLLRPIDASCPVSSFITNKAEHTANRQLAAVDSIREGELIAIRGGYLINVATAPGQEEICASGIRMYGSLYLAGKTRAEQLAVTPGFTPSLQPNSCRRHDAYFALSTITPGQDLTVAAD